MNKISHREHGAVSIFIVIFTALLVTIVTTSFVQIMLRNQQQASNNELSQSAYDSAMAGVEDAKRALVKLKECSRGPATPSCAAVNNLTTPGAEDNCEILQTAGVSTFNASGEVQVGDASLNQAYTCVKIDVETTSVDGKLDPNQAVVIPLIPVGNSNDITSVRISWYSASDLPDGVTQALLPTDTSLPAYALWGSNVPPIIRAQLIQFNSNASIDVTKFDEGNARTRLLYPLAGVGSTSFVNDNRRASPGQNQVSPGGCVQNLASGYKGYACSVTVTLPPMGGGEQREAYLQLAGYYIRQDASVHYSIELNNGGINPVDFDNVQPKIDATGRASDMFRRVRASVSVSDAGVPSPFPEATVTTRNLCKDFFITNDAVQYNPNASGGDLCQVQ